MLRARLATAAVAIPLLIALIFWAPAWGLAAVVGVLAVLALIEYAGLAFSAQPRDRLLTLAMGVPVIAAAVIGAGPGPPLTASMALAVAVGLLWVVAVRRDFDRGLSDLGIIWIGILYVGLLLPHFVWLHQSDGGARWVTFVIAVGMAGDSAGYFVGRAFGRHPLLPRVSPGKTREGALGILAGSVVVGLIGKWILLPEAGWGEVLLLSLCMGVLGQVGDLSESVMKRTYGSKESGWIFPGHGGVLDRIDSLLFPVVLVYYYRTL